MPQERILVVDDDPTIRQLEKRILESAGYKVDTAENGNDALQLIETYRYSVVVADVMMPEMDGYELTRRIKQRFQKSLPVVLVTAVPKALDAAHNQDAHPMSVLQKPFTPAALLTAVKLLASQKMSKAPSHTAPPKNESKGWFDRFLKKK